MMTDTYRGKTKDVHKRPGLWLLCFKDSVLGRAGVPDAGGNEVVGSEPGRGAASLRVALWTFAVLERAGLPTHCRGAADGGMLIQPGDRLPLEVVVRNAARGSFLARYGSRIAPGAPLGGLVELTLKDDAADDPLLTPEAAAALGLATADELRELDRLARAANRALTAAFAARGLALEDCKLEFARHQETRGLMVIDELGVNTMRVRRGGRELAPAELAAALA